MVFAQLLKRMKADRFAPHGLRSAFRDWAGDLSTFLREVAGQALVHRVGESTELAYRRAGALEKRLKLMAAWQPCTYGKNSSTTRPLSLNLTITPGLSAEPGWPTAAGTASEPVHFWAEAWSR